MEEIKLQRSVGLYFFLNTITLGIYGMFFWQRLTRDVNKLLWRKDGQHTPGALPLYLFSFLTFGIYFWPWHHRLYRRLTGSKGVSPITATEGCLAFFLWLPLFGIFLFVNFTKAQREIIEAVNRLAFEACVNAEEEKEREAAEKKAEAKEKEKEKNKKEEDELYW